MDLVTRKRQAQALEDQGNTAKALQLYQKILAELERNGDGLKEIPLYVKTGDLFVQERNGKAAVKMYDRAAQRYAVQGSGRHVISLCAKIGRLAPQLERLHHRYAGLLLKRSHFAEAHRVLTAYAQSADVEGMAEVLELMEGLEDSAIKSLLQPFVESDDESAVAAAQELLEGMVEPEEEEAAEVEVEEQEDALANRPVRPSIVTANIASDDMDDESSESSTTLVEPGLIQSSAEFISSEPAASAPRRKSSANQESVEWFGGFVPAEEQEAAEEPEYEEAAAEYEDDAVDESYDESEEEEYAEEATAEDDSDFELVSSPEVEFGTPDEETFHDPGESHSERAAAEADAEDAEEGFVVKSGVSWDSDIDPVEDERPFKAQPDLRASGTFDSLLGGERVEPDEQRLANGSGAFNVPAEPAAPVPAPQPVAPPPLAAPAPSSNVDTDRPSGMVEASTEAARRSEPEIEALVIEPTSSFSLGPPTMEMMPVANFGPPSPRESGAFGSPPSRPSDSFSSPSRRPSGDAFAPPVPSRAAGQRGPMPKKVRRRRRFPTKLAAAAILLLAAGFGLYRSGINPQELWAKWGPQAIMASSQVEPAAETPEPERPVVQAPEVRIDVSELALPGQIQIGAPTAPPSVDLADAQTGNNAASPASPSGS